MSLTISYKPLSDKGTSISGSTTLRQALENSFGNFPCQLDEHSIPILQGIKSCGHEGAQELIDAIEELKEIEVDGSY